MKKFDKNMILTFALQGMKQEKKDQEDAFRERYETEDTDYLLDEIDNLNNLIKNLESSLEREDTELVD